MHANPRLFWATDLSGNIFRNQACLWFVGNILAYNHSGKGLKRYFHILPLNGNSNRSERWGLGQGGRQTYIELQRLEVVPTCAVTELWRKYRLWLRKRQLSPTHLILELSYNSAHQIHLPLISSPLPPSVSFPRLPFLSQFLCSKTLQSKFN